MFMCKKKMVKRKRKSFRIAKRNYSARTIQQAWRRRKRAKVSLVTRTVTANRRNIRRINRKIEVKYLDNFLIATPINLFQGQFMTRYVGVDIDGEELGGVSVGLQPLVGMVGGTQDDQKVGNNVTLKRITFRYSVRAGYCTAIPPQQILPEEQQQYVTFAVIHDDAPDGTLPKWPAIFKASTGADHLQHPQNVFLNVDNVGKTSRYRVLKTHTVQVQVNQKYYATSSENALLAPTQTSLKRGSFHVQAPYLIKYGGTQTPMNQNIYVIACSNVIKNTDQNALNMPEICLNARVAYKDG